MGFFLLIPTPLLGSQISDGLFSLTKINLHASLCAIHPGGGATLPAAKPNPQQAIDLAVHLHSRQLGEGNLNEEPGNTLILLNEHCVSTVPYSEIQRKISINERKYFTCNFSCYLSLNTFRINITCKNDY